MILLILYMFRWKQLVRGAVLEQEKGRKNFEMGVPMGPKGRLHHQ